MNPQKRFVKIALIILLFIFFQSGFSRAQEQGKKWALLIGIDQYDSGDITPLKYAQSDAKGLEYALVNYCGFSKENVFVLTSNSKNRMRSTRPNIVDWLVRLRKVVKPQDTFIFSFSGHGMSKDNLSYLLTADSITTPIENLELSALNMTTLRSLIEKITASKKVIIIDACRNDPAGGKGSGDNLMTKGFANDLKLKQGGKNKKIEISATLYACSVGERSFEWQEKHHGFFTYFLIEGLSGKAKDSSGNVTLNSLVTYLETTVPEQINLWKGGAAQTPWAEYSGTGAGRWVISEKADQNINKPESLETRSGNDSQAPQTISYADLAEDAYKKGKYAEPVQYNAIEYSQKALIEDPQNSAAKTIESQSASEYEKEAIKAVSNNNIKRAIEIYTRLTALFPDSKKYAEELDKLKNPKIPDITGKWETSAMIGEINIDSNGNCVYNGFLIITVKGTWKCTDTFARKFEIHWEHGYTDYLILSEDGNKLEGKNDEGAAITMKKIK